VPIPARKGLVLSVASCFLSSCGDFVGLDEVLVLGCMRVMVGDVEVGRLVLHLVHICVVNKNEIINKLLLLAKLSCSLPILSKDTRTGSL